MNLSNPHLQVRLDFLLCPSNEEKVKSNTGEWVWELQARERPGKSQTFMICFSPYWTVKFLDFEPSWLSFLTLLASMETNGKASIDSRWDFKLSLCPLLPFSVLILLQCSGSWDNSASLFRSFSQQNNQHSRDLQSRGQRTALIFFPLRK